MNLDRDDSFGPLLVIVCAMSLAVALIFGTGCKALGLTGGDVAEAGIECGSAEVIEAMRAKRCAAIDPPAVIAVRVAECMARKVFGDDPSYCAGYSPDGGK